MKSLEPENTRIVACANSGMLAIVLLSFCVASTMPSSVAAGPVGPLNTFFKVSNAYEVNFGANARLLSNVQTPQLLEELPVGIQATSKESGAPHLPSNRREVAVFARTVRSGSCGLRDGIHENSTFDQRGFSMSRYVGIKVHLGA